MAATMKQSADEQQKTNLEQNPASCPIKNSIVDHDHCMYETKL
jgi:hypothetical protein